MRELMGSTDIAFPNIGIYLENVPKSFSVFGFSIAFYGVIIGLGVIAGLLMVTHDAKVTGQNPDDYWDFAIYAIIFSVLGARAYYVIFSWDHYKDNLIEVINIRNGGMAIYGAVIAAFATALIYCKKKKMNVFQLLDTGVLGLILGQIIGRWGNFMNREAFGEYSDGLFAMALPIDAVRSHEITDTIAAHIVEGTNYIMVHPTFLYESVLNIIVLIAMLCYKKHKKFHGEVALFYLGGYGIVRFLVEGLRTDQLLIPVVELPVSQLLGICLFVVSIGVDLFVRVRTNKKEKTILESRVLRDNQQLTKSE